MMCGNLQDEAFQQVELNHHIVSTTVAFLGKKLSEYKENPSKVNRHELAWLNECAAIITEKSSESFVLTKQHLRSEQEKERDNQRAEAKGTSLLARATKWIVNRRDILTKALKNNARTRESSATENVPAPQSLLPASRAPIAEKRLPPQSQLVAMVPEPEPESTEPALMESESELTDPPKEPEPRAPEELSVTEQVLMSSQISNDHLSRIEGELELDLELEDDQEHMLVGPFDAITPVTLVVDGLMKGNNSHHDVLEAVSSFSTVIESTVIALLICIILPRVATS